MRIVAGAHRGRKLLGPKDQHTTRPITDRLKTSLFDRLEHLDAIENVTVLDGFCGTGTLGLEALSRGAAHVTFVDQDRDALHRLKQNLAAMGETDKASIERLNALRPTLLLSKLHAAFGLIFLDPPYALLHEAKGWPRVAALIEALAEVSAEDALLVLRTEKQFDPEPVPPWAGPEVRQQGGMKLCFYSKSN